MFTGLIETVGELRDSEQRDNLIRWTIDAPMLLNDLALGDSVAVNGVCLTVTSLTAAGFTTDLMGETLAISALGTLPVHAPLNLERALRLGDRLGGHLVQGHVDGTGRVLSFTRHAEWAVPRISLPADLVPLLIYKGSITVNGVALTVSAISAADAADPWFEVSLIPETLEHTTLNNLTVDDVVNLESDLIARQVQRIVATSASAGSPAAAAPFTAQPTHANKG